MTQIGTETPKYSFSSICPYMATVMYAHNPTDVHRYAHTYTHTHICTHIYKCTHTDTLLAADLHTGGVYESGGGLVLQKQPHDE